MKKTTIEKLMDANKALLFQNEEKSKRVAELELANKELAFQNEEKSNRAVELVISEKRLEESIIALETYSYTISHDLKAPIRHIAGFASLLESKYIDLLPEEGRKYLTNISTAAKTMEKLIDGLLQFYRSDRIPIKPSVLDMNEIVNALIQPFIEQDTKQRISFKIEKMPSAFGDADLIKSVWSNLIENAVKFTKNKAVATIFIGATDADLETTYFVKDNGAGFDMNYASKLFGIFQRLHSQEAFEGTGIGLATVRQIIAKHCGRTWAEGNIDEGTTFYFTLPKDKEDCFNGKQDNIVFGG